MERLSDRAIEILDELHTERLDYHSEYMPLIEAAHKLSEYEATGLEPSEIQCAKENLHILDLFKEQAQDAEECIRIAEARRDGKLAILPVRVGDIIYTMLSMSGWYLRQADKPYKARVVFIGLNKSESMGGGVFNVVYEKGKHMAQFCFSDIGKNVFLTKEQAKQTVEQREYILKTLQDPKTKSVFGYAFGSPMCEVHNPDETVAFSTPADIVEISASDVRVDPDRWEIFYEWGWPGPDTTSYKFSDYGKTWAFSREELEDALKTKQEKSHG